MWSISLWTSWCSQVSWAHLRCLASSSCSHIMPYCMVELVIIWSPLVTCNDRDTVVCTQAWFMLHLRTGTWIEFTWRKSATLDQLESIDYLLDGVRFGLFILVLQPAVPAGMVSDNEADLLEGLQPRCKEVPSIKYISRLDLTHASGAERNMMQRRQSLNGSLQCKLRCSFTWWNDVWDRFDSWSDVPDPARDHKTWSRGSLVPAVQIDWPSPWAEYPLPASQGCIPLVLLAHDQLIVDLMHLGWLQKPRTCSGDFTSQRKPANQDSCCSDAVTECGTSNFEPKPETF